MPVKNNRDDGYIQSPLNYTGGKYRLLPQILPLFPKNIDCFVDLFCGGANVGINVNCKNAILNDINANLISLLKLIKNQGDNLISTIDKIIDEYGLSKSSVFGYEYYSCDSGKGLGTYNKERFLSLRNDFNKHIARDDYHYSLLFVLIVFSFNNQIRFNSKGEYNLPVGKRDFNENMQEKLKKFIYRLKTKKYDFLNLDFRNLSNLKSNCFVYADPPYLITCASYNEQNGWIEKDEMDLLRFLDDLNSKKIKFALSNVLANKNKENSILIEWLNKNNYKVNRLNYSYNNSNYHSKHKQSKTDEVLITNYEV